MWERLSHGIQLHAHVILFSENIAVLYSRIYLWSKKDKHQWGPQSIAVLRGAFSKGRTKGAEENQNVREGNAMQRVSQFAISTKVCPGLKFHLFCLALL